MSPALLLCPDLFFSSRLSAMCTNAGLTPNVVYSVAAAESEAAANNPVVVLLDLSTDITPQAVRDLFPNVEPMLIAFGPHVRTARLKAARTANFDHVLTHSQLDDRLPALLAGVAETNACEDADQPGH